MRILKNNHQAFTLIELVMVIAIVGTLAAIAIPTFQNLTRTANDGATRGGLGAIRAAVFIEYARSAITGADPAFPADITSTMFAQGSVPTNILTNSTVVNEVAIVVTGGALVNANAWWYVTAGVNEGRVGAYTDDTSLSDPTSW